MGHFLTQAKRVIFGETNNEAIKTIKDLNLSEGSTLTILAIIMIFFGFYPQPLIDTISVSVNHLISNYQNDLFLF